MHNVYFLQLFLLIFMNGDKTSGGHCTSKYKDNFPHTHSHLFFIPLSIHFHMPYVNPTLEKFIHQSNTRPIISYTQKAYQSTPRSRLTAYTSKSSLQDASPGTVKSEGSKAGGVPGWLRVLVFIIVAVFLYYVYSNMESADENPFKKIDT